MNLIMEQFELDMDILQSKYERVNEDLEFLIRKCDMKYIAESGTEDDLTALYTEANEQANEKKKNILQNMIGKLLSFIQKILFKLKGLSNKIKSDNEYEVVDIVSEINETNKLQNEFKSIIYNKDQYKSDKLEKISKKQAIILASLGVTAAVTTYVVANKRIKIVQGKKLQNDIDELEESIKENSEMARRIKEHADNIPEEKRAYAIQLCRQFATIHQHLIISLKNTRDKLDKLNKK